MVPRKTRGRDRRGRGGPWDGKHNMTHSSHRLEIARRGGSWAQLHQRKHAVPGCAKKHCCNVASPVSVGRPFFCFSPSPPKLSARRAVLSVAWCEKLSARRSATVSALSWCTCAAPCHCGCRRRKGRKRRRKRRVDDKAVVLVAVNAIKMRTTSGEQSHATAHKHPGAEKNPSTRWKDHLFYGPPARTI